MLQCRSPLAASGASAFGIATVVCIAMYQKKTRYPRSKSGTTRWLSIYGASTTQGVKSTIGGSSVASAQLSSEAAANCSHFSLQEIKKATKNFDKSHVIGVGGFGKVYRCTIDVTTKVAIKRSNPSSEQGVKKIDIPNYRVGVIIGKGGETIKYLQTQSGAKIWMQTFMLRLGQWS